MYTVGTLLLYERRGVYEIESVGAPPVPLEDGCAYYSLRSAFSTSNERMYVPVDTKAFMRPLMSESQVEECLELASRLETQVFHSRKTTDLLAHYRSMLSSCQVEDCLLLIKEIHAKQKDMAGHRKKLGQVDQQYLRLAERLICEEFAAVLHITPEQAQKRLYGAMRRKAVGSEALKQVAL